MIRGLHGMFYTSDANASRMFLRDQLKLPYTDVGEGWLIFDLPQADLGVHPTEGVPHTAPAGRHDVSFFCDDIQGTVADLKSRGVSFTAEVADHGYGWVTYFDIPGGIHVQLYEPKYQKRVPLAAAAPKAKAKPKAKAEPKPTARAKARRPAPKARAKARPPAKKSGKKR